MRVSWSLAAASHRTCTPADVHAKALHRPHDAKLLQVTSSTANSLADAAAKKCARPPELQRLSSSVHIFELEQPHTSTRNSPTQLNRTTSWCFNFHRQQLAVCAVTVLSLAAQFRQLQVLLVWFAVVRRPFDLQRLPATLGASARILGSAW